MGKKMIVCLLTAFLLCGSVSALAAQPELESQTACLMDADTGQILYEKDAQTELPMASITKVMTALLVIENGDLNATTVATAEAINSVDLASTRVGFEPGEELTVDELMYCMLVDSANDAANILACYVGGDVETFVEMMNEKAEELGCTHTHFANPNGLDMDGHYSCAHDMALITYAANQYPEFAQYSSTVSYQLPADNVIGQGWQVFTRVNMIKPDDPTYDARVYAAKTGWTTKAQNTFVACGKSDQANLIVTVLGSPEKTGIFTDTTALLDYGEQAYKQVTLSVDNYEKAAEEAAKEAGCTIDTDALGDFTLRLPVGMGVDDLTYTCETTETGAYLCVMIAEESRAAYADVTGMDGTQPLLRVALSLTCTQTEDSGGAAVEVMSQDSGSMVNGMSDIAHRVLIVVVVVIGAMILMFLLLFLLGLYRRMKQRSLRKKR